MEKATPESWLQLKEQLGELADGLRDAGHIDPDARRELAELLAELSQALASTSLPPNSVEHLVASTTHVARALQHPPEQGAAGSAVERLEQVVLDAESRAPVLAGITRRLVDALTNIGI